MTDNIKMPPMPHAGHPIIEEDVGSRAYGKHDMEAYAREAVRLNAQAVPDGWKLVPVQATPDMCKAAVIYANGNAVYKNVAHEALEIEESIYSEVYSAMLSAAPAAPQPAQPAQPLDLSVMELAESVGLIGPASRTDDLHDAIQRFHDLIVANASIKAALHFADGLAKQTLTDEQIRSIGRQQDPTVIVHHNVLAFARAIEQAHGIGVKND